jgi:hypothetical protein
LSNGKVKIAKVKRADSVSLALDDGAERSGNEPAIMYSSILMIKVAKKDEVKDEKK